MRQFNCVLLLFIGAFALPSVALAASATVEPFGQTASGQAVSKITMRNDANMQVSVMSYGATMTEITVPDRKGTLSNVVLSLPNIHAYERTRRRWGGIIGRYAGRISNAQFSLDGKVARLEAGRNGVTLHGGTNGYDKRVWTFRTAQDRRSVSTIFTLSSPDGDQGFPGALDLEVTYRLMRASNELRIEYRARTSAPTVVNFTNHAFVNLAGAGNGTIGDHELTLMTPNFAPTDDRKIPTGALLPTAGTVLNFSRPQKIGRFLQSNDPLLLPSKGYDHSYTFARPKSAFPRLIARLRDPQSGRRLAIFTTEPGLQFNTGNGFDGTEVGSEGAAYPIYAGVALETQHLPDSPNQRGFPSTRLDPGGRFYSVTIYKFSVD